jgi:hypothetical protein
MGLERSYVPKWAGRARHFCLMSSRRGANVQVADNEKHSIGSAPAEKWCGATEWSGRSASDRMLFIIDQFRGTGETDRAGW